MKVFAILFLAFCGANAERVIGGANAANNQFPSIVFQEKNGGFFCGGTIIAANRVLTAAHCKQATMSGLTVTAGTNTRSTGGTTINVDSKLVHPDYDSSTTQNDVQILYLETSFSFGTTIQKASLVDTTPSAGTPITVAGWGDTNSGIIQNLPDNLQFVEVNVIATSTCNGVLAYNGEVLAGMMCIGDMQGGEDTCQGDSGGPAYLSDESTVAGITSWGYGCAQANKPGVYTDVAYFHNWITSNM